MNHSKIHQLDTSNRPLIIFDIDGTLTNTTDIDNEAFRLTFKELYNFDIDELDWGKFKHATDWGITGQILDRILKIENVNDEIENVQTFFLKSLMSNSKKQPDLFAEVPGAADFLQNLRSLEYPIGIATGAWKESAQIKLSHIGIDPDDYPWAHSDDHFSRQRITELCIERASDFYNQHFLPEDVIYFGDGVWDLKTTTTMDVKFVGVDVKADGKLFCMGQRKIIRNYLDIQNVLDLIQSFKLIRK